MIGSVQGTVTRRQTARGAYAKMLNVFTVCEYVHRLKTTDEYSPQGKVVISSNPLIAMHTM